MRGSAIETNVDKQFKQLQAANLLKLNEQPQPRGKLHAHDTFSHDTFFVCHIIICLHRSRICSALVFCMIWDDSALRARVKKKGLKLI